MTKILSVDDRVAVALLDGELELPEICRAVPAVSGQLIQSALRILSELNVVDVRRNEDRKIVYFLQEPHGETYAESLREGLSPPVPPRPFSKPTQAVAPPAKKWPPPVPHSAESRKIKRHLAAHESNGSFNGRGPISDEAAEMHAREVRRKTDDKPATLDAVVANEKARNQVPMTSPAQQKAAESVIRSYLDKPTADPATIPRNMQATAAALAADPMPEPTLLGIDMAGNGDRTFILQPYVPAQPKIVTYYLGDKLVLRADTNDAYGVNRIELGPDAAHALYTMLHQRYANAD